MRGARPRVGVSSCLLGEEVRFNGGHKRYRFLTDELGRYVDWVPYCPEIEIGLGTPREPIRLTAAGRLVNRGGTADHTAAMTDLPLPADLDGYVFKAKSPSCGIRAIPRYRADGRLQPAASDGHRGDGQPADHAGRGLYAARVLGAVPAAGGRGRGTPERPGAAGGVCRAHLRGGPAAFPVERAMVGRGPGRLPRQAQAAGAGARSGALPVGGPGGGRGRHRAARADRRSVPGSVPGRDGEPGDRGRHANALQHAYSRIGRELDRPRRHDLVARIEAYRRGEEPLSVPIALLAHYALGLPWLAEQTYLRPFPPDLRLRHSVSAEAG